MKRLKYTIEYYLLVFEVSVACIPIILLYLSLYTPQIY